MMNILNDLINKLEYTYTITLDLDFLNSTLLEYECMLEGNQDFTCEELLHIHYLIALCKNHLHDDNDIYHFKICIYYAVQLDDKSLLGKCYLHISKSFLTSCEFDKYYYCFNVAEEIFTSNKNYCDLSKLYLYSIFGKVKISDCSSEITQLISQTLDALTYFESEYSAQVYMLLGSLHSVYLKDNYLAIELYKKALLLANKYNSTFLKIIINYHIAVGYINLDRNNEACIILETILSDNLSSSTNAMNCIFAIELLNLYLKTGSNIDSIISGITFIEEISEPLPRPEELQVRSQLLFIKCELALLLKDTTLDILLNWINEAKEIYDFYKTSYRFSHADYIINNLFGDIYYEFGHYDKALHYHKISLALSAKYEVRYVITAHQKLSKDYAALNNYKKAYIHMEKIDTIRSTIQHANLLENYTKVYTEYEHFKENEETKNQFFANLSHELKTPINIIYSSIQLLNFFKDTDDLKFKQYYKKHERSVTQNCLRILKLIDNLIDTTKIDSGSFNLTFANYDIIKLVEDITLSTLPYIEMKNLNMVFDTEIEQLEIKCDPYAIERIILNLLSNAIKFTNDGGNINVIISLKDTYVCIKVNDDGIGIPHSMRDKIFEKFIQVDNALNRKKEGSGIGLSLVKSIVELHNGRIYINSTRMRGSEFIVLLPNIKITEGLEKLTYTNYVPNTSKISAEFSDIYELIQ